ncbi:MAG: aminomethyl-transferring glycine dehydrogenase subunit GcvPA [Deltaproteobacteria bacterium]|nr:aminomethyl-transferring glycine dehydrogenase subunit GcvPA [Deltaproteobacteria bacterium]
MYTPHTDEDIRRMLERIGVGSVDELFARAVPGEMLTSGGFEDVPEAMDLASLIKTMRALSDRNTASCIGSCFAGGGAYAHLVHPAVDQIISRSEFLTAYTPYQAEVSQGTLQAVFEFQTMVAELLGTQVANASMYDGASAAAEAALMARRVTKRNKVLVSEALHPEYRHVIRTYLAGLAPEGVEEVLTIGYAKDTGATDTVALAGRLGDDVAAVVVGYPNVFGVVEDLTSIAKAAHDAGALLVTATAEPVSLGILEAPAVLGADIPTAEGQALGLPVSFGGPGVGLFGCSKKKARHMPGRLVGRTVDTRGKNGYVLTLAMREQHIRRERATSNICTNQGLCALAVTVHLSLLGPEGLREQALMSAANAHALRERIAALDGFEDVFDGPFFNEFAIRSKRVPVADLIEGLAERRLLAGPALGRWYPELANVLLVSTTECLCTQDMDALVAALREVGR